MSRRFRKRKFGVLGIGGAGYLVSIPAYLKLLVSPYVEILPLLIYLPHYTPDGKVIQVHLGGEKYNMNF